MGITDKKNDMKKIMFNDRFGLTQAVLEGRKTMTRRSVSDKILKKYQDYQNWWNTQKGGFKVPEDEFCRCESPLKVNDVIAIAQAYKDTPATRDFFKDADFIKKYKKTSGWNNKMFVKAELMPHHIKITGIKVERLQDCSDDDILKEGVQFCANCSRYTILDCDEKHCFDSPREAFAALIDKVSGKGTWERNPYCFCYTFKLID